MHSPKRLKITDVNPHLICVLCGGYYIDATTVIECLHSFCKTCIVKYLEKNKYCPICDVQIHKSSPLLSIRPDNTLQNIVYKLVPSLFKNEMQRRVTFYEKHPEAIPALPEQRGEVTEDTPIYFPDELLIVCLQYHDNQATHQMTRYLHCPASLPVSHLVKLIRGKFSLNAKQQVNLFFKDDLIKENITLMDIAYTYQCRRKTPIHLTYKILEFRRKTIRIINYEPRKESKEEKEPEKEWKEVQLQISETGVMSVRNMENGESSPIPAVEAPSVISPSMISSMNYINHSSSNTPPTPPLPPLVSQSTSSSNGNQAVVSSQPCVSTMSDISIAETSTPMEVNSCSDKDNPSVSSCVTSSGEQALTSTSSNDVTATSSVGLLLTLSTTAISTNSVSSYPVNSVLLTTPTTSVSPFPPSSLSMLSAMSTASFTTNPLSTFIVNSVSTTPTLSTSSTPTNSLPSPLVSITTTSSAASTAQSAAVSSPRTSSPLQSTLSLKRTRSPFPKSSSPLPQNFSPAPSPQAGSSPLHRSTHSPLIPSPIHSSVPILQQLPSPLPASSPSLYSPSFQTSPASLQKPSSPLMSPLPVSSSQLSPLVSMSKSITSLSASIVTPAMSLPISSSAPLPPSTSSLLPPITTHSVPLLPPPLSIASPPVSLAGYPSPSLPTSPSIISPQAVLGNSMPHSPQGTVTTMSGMKSSPSIVPISYPIMSTCRTQSEPIVSVSKVSKDQVRKPNNSVQVNKLSISRVLPGGMKEKSENLNKIVNKLSPNERVIGNTSVTIRPVSNSPNPPKLYQLPKSPISQSPPTPINKEKPQAKYRSLKSPTKQWNPSVDRNSMLLKQTSDQSKSSRFLKMRNMPRFLGNPSSGVKPLYACPEEPPNNSNQNKHKLMLKVDPKSIPTSSMSRSPTKQPPPYTPGSPKLSKPPPPYSEPKPFMNSRMPSPAHAGSFLTPNPYHLLYSGYPGFPHEANRMLTPELIRSMCAYHPSLNPSMGMLFNPMHSLPSRPQDNFKPDPTPSVQRIPPTKNETTSPKPTATPSQKPVDEKRLPSHLDVPEPKKLTTPSPATPMEVDKPTPTVQETPPKLTLNSDPTTIPAEPPSQNSISDVNDTKVSTDTKDVKPNDEDNDVKKLNCDDLNLNNNNNNNSKESPTSQPSENLANKSQ